MDALYATIKILVSPVEIPMQKVVKPIVKPVMMDTIGLVLAVWETSVMTMVVLFVLQVTHHLNKIVYNVPRVSQETDQNLTVIAKQDFMKQVMILVPNVQ